MTRTRDINLKAVICLMVLLVMSTGCTQGSAPSESQVPPTATVTPSPPTITPSPTQPPIEHRIGIRVIDGIGEFYDKVSGEKFVPRGNNYIRLTQQQDASGASILYHSTFNVGLYDPARAEAALRQMHAEGYNVVRVFLNGCCAEGTLANPDGGLSSDYLNNLADFLRKAKENDMYVILTTDSFPDLGGYIVNWSDDFRGVNPSYLTAEGVSVEAQFVRDLLRGMLEHDVPLDIILAYELRNEMFFEGDQPPFSLTSGTVQIANGKSYDLASEEAKQQMMNDGMVYWIDSARRAVSELDPTALVTIGFFWPKGPNPARADDPRVFETRPAIWESGVDFIDLHPYPGEELNLAQYVENFGMDGMQEKPIIMGEFGAGHYSFTSEAKVASVLQNWQIESCKFGFDGWLLWTYDTEEQTDFYNGLTGNGLINQALMPSNRLNPCE